MRVNILYCAITMVLSSNLNAGELFFKDSYNESEGLYLGLGTGIAIVISDSDVESHTQHNAKSFKLESGYDFTKFLGIYGGYGHMSNFGFDNGSQTDLNIIEMGLKGNIPISGKLSAFGKIGGAYITADNQDVSVIKKSNSVLAGGIGLEYQITNSVIMKLGYDQYSQLKYLDGKEFDVGQFFWGVNYKFGQPKDRGITTEKQVVEVIKEVVVEPPLLKRYLVFFELGEDKLNAYSDFSIYEVAQTLKLNLGLRVVLVGRTDASGS
ncbi:exported hypothetical protein [Vibrio crassostreae]|nr:exported hypothetical protein [Vibrio crassostreae]